MARRSVPMHPLLTLAAGVAIAACGPSSSADDGSGDASGSAGSSSTGVASITSDDGGSTSGGSGSGGSGSGGSTDGTTGTVPPIECETTLESDLPGVAIDIEADCAYTLATAQAGVETGYVVSIGRALSSVDSGNSCYPTPMGGIHVEWFVRGNGLQHCECDIGLCPPYEPMPTTLVPGETPGTFSWAAYQWNGPSDTGQPYGDPFPPGDYEIEVIATGFWDDGVSTRTPFTVRATRPVVLVP